jgi:hypothetical protein
VGWNALNLRISRGLLYPNPRVILQRLQHAVRNEVKLCLPFSICYTLWSARQAGPAVANCLACGFPHHHTHLHEGTCATTEPSGIDNTRWAIGDRIAPNTVTSDEVSQSPDSLARQGASLVVTVFPLFGVLPPHHVVCRTDNQPGALSGNRRSSFGKVCVPADIMPNFKSPASNTDTKCRDEKCSSLLERCVSR